MRVEKTVDEKRRAYGWLSVSLDANGDLVEDCHKSVIFPEDLEEAMVGFMLEHRRGDDMHSVEGVAKVFEAMTFTAEKWAALGGRPEGAPVCGTWIGVEFEHGAEGDTAWAAVKRGDRPMFSLGGTAIPEILEP